jgi:diguanylate cyclase (GGDEF)-like protein
VNDMRAGGVAGTDTAVFAWEWARMLAGTSWVAADRTVIADKLRDLTGRVLAALDADPFESAAGIDIGAELVQIGFASPDALARTVTLLTDGLPHDNPDRTRLAALVGMVSHGFVRAVRDRTLDEQEAIRSSAMVAWQRARTQQLEQALSDPLTGLFNRPGFSMRLGELVLRHPEGVVGATLLCVDGFDTLDRCLGREVGDQLLKTVAARLAERFGGDHEVVARVGRDEFMVAGIDRSEAEGAVARRLAEAQGLLSEPIVADDRSIVLSTSSGLVARSVKRTEPDQLLRDADLAASWARSRGPGGVAVFDNFRAARQLSDVELTADLPAAIAGGGLQAHYQPIVSLRTGRVVAVEALARWTHAEHGMLTPDRFLHLAERGGLLTAVGRAMLGQACRQARAWQLDLARAPVVAVNVAADQLGDWQTVRDVMAVLETTGLAPELLQLEITEHAALDDPGTLLVIRDLARCGIQLAIDDFGTGRAHLAQLPDLPANGVRTLKLPVDFVQFRAGRPAVADDAARVRLLASTIDLAHSLDLRVTVEGIETADQDRLIRKLGADQGQGAHYAIPEAADRVERLLRTGGRVRS